MLGHHQASAKKLLRRRSSSFPSSPSSFFPSSSSSTSSSSFVETRPTRAGGKLSAGLYRCLCRCGFYNGDVCISAGVLAAVFVFVVHDSVCAPVLHRRLNAHTSSRPFRAHAQKRRIQLCKSSDHLHVVARRQA